MGANSTAVQSLLTHPAGAIQPCLVPKLRFIAFKYIGGFNTRVFLEMIKSRWRLDSGIRDADEGPVPARITSVELCSITDISIFEPASLGLLRAFKDEGLDIKLFDQRLDPILF